MYRHVYARSNRISAKYAILKYVFAYLLGKVSKKNAILQI